MRCSQRAQVVGGGLRRQRGAIQQGIDKLTLEQIEALGIIVRWQAHLVNDKPAVLEYAKSGTLAARHRAFIQRGAALALLAPILGVLADSVAVK
jgi:hypothetical protein